MIIDNFDLLQTQFSKLVNKEDFFFIQLIQRKKDGNKSHVREIKNFYIYNEEDFLKQKDCIISLCKYYNARAYFWVNPRNARDISLECIRAYADLINQKDCSKGYKLWDKKCGVHPSSAYERLWVVDIDSKDQSNLNLMCELINTCWKDNSRKIGYVIPTVNGYHIITNKFNTHFFEQLLIINQLGHIDIHKDGPTLLYYEET